jgi:hypothetical protein
MTEPPPQRRIIVAIAILYDPGNGGFPGTCHMGKMVVKSAFDGLPVPHNYDPLALAHLLCPSPEFGVYRLSIPEAWACLHHGFMDTLPSIDVGCGFPLILNESQAGAFGVTGIAEHHLELGEEAFPMTTGMVIPEMVAPADPILVLDLLWRPIRHRSP